MGDQSTQEQQKNQQHTPVPSGYRTYLSSDNGVSTLQASPLGEGKIADETDASNAQNSLQKLITRLNIGNDERQWDIGGPFTPLTATDHVSVVRLPGLKETIQTPFDTAKPEQWFDTEPPAVSSGHIKQIVFVDSDTIPAPALTDWYGTRAPALTTPSGVVHLKMVIAPGLFDPSNDGYLYSAWNHGVHPFTKVKFLTSPEHSEAVTQLINRIGALDTSGNFQSHVEVETVTPQS